MKDSDILAVLISYGSNNLSDGDAVKCIRDLFQRAAHQAVAAPVEADVTFCECGYGCPSGRGCRHSGEAPTPAEPAQTRSQKLAAVGHKRRPTWRSLPPEDGISAEPAQQDTATNLLREASQFIRAEGEHSPTSAYLLSRIDAVLAKETI